MNILIFCSEENSSDGRLLKQKIEEAGHQVTFSSNFVSALILFNQNQNIELVIFLNDKIQLSSESPDTIGSETVQLFMCQVITRPEQRPYVIQKDKGKKQEQINRGKKMNSPFNPENKTVFVYRTDPTWVIGTIDRIEEEIKKRDA